jgi:hypothetical protein
MGGGRRGVGGVGGGCKEVVSVQENKYCYFLTEHADVTLNAKWNKESSRKSEIH